MLMFHKILFVNIVLILMTSNMGTSTESESVDPMANKTIPSSIYAEAEKAISHFPDLADVAIEIKFTNRTHKSFMQAQPKFSSLLRSRDNREYYIFINNAFTVEGESFNVEELPSEVLIGWIGHELGHIMDYLDRGKLEMIWFGVKYLYMPKFVIEAERIADTYAVDHGLGEYLIKTKDFIFESTSLSNNYKSNIERFYLSPEEIMQMVDNKAEESSF